MINGQREIWIATSNTSKRYSAIIAVSNCGRIMRKNSKIEIASIRQLVSVGEKRLRMLLYRFLANNFIKKTEDDKLKQRTVIDHISHKPDNMYINDVRNLRWCTYRENCNFPEAKFNQSKAQKGEKHPMYGKQHSEETKSKMSAAKTGEKNAMYGKKHSAETKEKMSKAQLGHFVSDESKEKMSKVKKGRHWYNNGTKNVAAFECPEGYVPGKLSKKRIDVTLLQNGSDDN